MESTSFFRVPPNRSIKSLARESLKNKWGIAALAYLIYVILYLLADAIPMPVLRLPFFQGNTFWNGYFVLPLLITVVDSGLQLGLTKFSLEVAKNRKADISIIFTGFNQIVQAVIAYVLIRVMVILGLLLFIVPGLIALAGFSFTFQIIAENPSIKAIDALKKSWEMTYGYKQQLVMLYLDFLLSMILSVFTLFIGLFWLMPYMLVAFSVFYVKIKGEDISDDEFEIGDHLIEMT